MFVQYGDDLHGYIFQIFKVPKLYQTFPSLPMIWSGPHLLQVSHAH